MNSKNDDDVKKWDCFFFLFFTFYMGRSSAFNKQKSSQN